MGWVTEREALGWSFIWIQSSLLQFKTAQTDTNLHSPDDFTTWGYDSSTGIPPSLDPLDLGTHCEFMSDGESEEEEEEEGQREVLVSPGRLFDIFLRETLRRERRQLQTSSVRAGLDV